MYVAEASGLEITGGATQVMKLLKCLYGLPDSTINWWNTIDPYLVEIGFEPLKSDTCVYIYTAKKGVTIIITLYVDDLFLLGGDAVLLEMFKKNLISRFKTADRGNVSHRRRHASHPRPREGHLDHQSRGLHQVHAREIRHERVQASEYTRLQTKAITGAARGKASG